MKSKFSITERVIERYAASRIAKFVDAMRVGWNAYNFIFYIASIAAIFGILTGWLGLFYVIVTILFFYYAGRFKEKVELVQKRNKLKSKKGSR
jgi:predicted permease